MIFQFRYHPGNAWWGHAGTSRARRSFVLGPPFTSLRPEEEEEMSLAKRSHPVAEKTDAH